MGWNRVNADLAFKCFLPLQIRLRIHLLFHSRCRNLSIFVDNNCSIGLPDNPQMLCTAQVDKEQLFVIYKLV